MDIAIAWALAGLPCFIYLGFAASYFFGGRSRRREHVERLLRINFVRDF